MHKGHVGLILMAAAVAFIVTNSSFLREHFVLPLGTSLAQVGVAVGVAPNPDNTLNEQLNAKQIQLDEEQADLASREAAFASTTATSAPGMLQGTSGDNIVIAILTLLVGLNYYLDWRRAAKERERERAAGQPSA